MLDILIKNATVVDGSGASSYKADLSRLKGPGLPKLGRCLRPQADLVIDASAHVVSPGFIDMHSHADLTPAVRTDGTQPGSSRDHNGRGRAVWPFTGAIA